VGESGAFKNSLKSGFDIGKKVGKSGSSLSQEES